MIEQKSLERADDDAIKEESRLRLQKAQKGGGSMEKVDVEDLPRLGGSIEGKSSPVDEIEEKLDV